MSRIGNNPIPLPKGVTVNIDGSKVSVKGPKGSLVRDLTQGITCDQVDDTIVMSTPDESKRSMAMKGLFRSLVNNMVIGVDKGFQKKLLVEGVGYKVQVAGSKVTLNVGYSNPVEFQLPEGVAAASENPGTLTLESIDKELLGQTAARIRQVRKPEPYKGKGIRYEDEHIVRKVGKSGAK